jgi:NAD(P)-dependent dehydrogenase (short-subunit alcohol dehydrogenase family)
MTLRGSTVAVVGGSSGMGFAIAAAALAKGARVVIGSSSAGRVAGAAARLGPGAVGHAVDVRDDASVAAFAAAVGEADHLVVTAHAPASLATLKPVGALDLDDVRAVLEVKVIGAVRVARALLPRLRAGGSVLFVSGAASRRMLPGHVVLGAGNAAVEAMARQLAWEAAPVRVNVLCPGLTRTEAYESLAEADRATMFARAAAALPVGRAGEPADLAAAALALMTNGFCTGAVLDCDGGGLLVGAPS